MSWVLLLFHYGRVCRKVHHRRIARPLHDEPDWIVGMLVHWYEGARSPTGRAFYVIAAMEWEARRA